MNCKFYKYATNATNTFVTFVEFVPKLFGPEFRQQNCLGIANPDNEVIKNLRCQQGRAFRTRSEQGQGPDSTVDPQQSRDLTRSGSSDLDKSGFADS